MGQFFKIFFASLLALIVFTVVAVFITLGIIGSITSSDKPVIGANAILYIDLSQPMMEQSVGNPLAQLGAEEQYDVPGLYDVVRMIHYAKSDSSVKGIYLKCNDNNNGLAASEELRNAIIDFKQSHKFVCAYGDVISQRAYYVANIADKIYCNPRGGIEWKGLSLQYMFFRQALDKLEIEPQIFYAGKFKSATEPFRADGMTDANRLQSTVFLNDIYARFLMETAAAINTDTATLHQYANNMLVRSASDAVSYKLADAAKYDDEVKDELRVRVGIGKTGKLNFVVPGKYAKAVNYKGGKGDDKIALIFAQGDIVDGKGENGEIGGETYRNLVRKARMDDDVKAIVVRVNSGGGSAMASENIWRELEVARKDKPVIISFGDYAASGGYYMSCGADSIFAQPNTLTGSIGVFSIVPNLKKFFNNKLGVTFDGVKTATYADMSTASRPLNDAEKRFFQNDVDSIYHTFLTRVSNGRNMNLALVDSIAQGRVWTGSRGVDLGLVDKLGGLQDAIDCAAGMAKLKDYRLKEFPEPTSWWDKFFGTYQKNAKTKALKAEMGEDGYHVYSSFQKIKQFIGSSQTRLPFEMVIE